MKFLRALLFWRLKFYVVSVYTGYSIQRARTIVGANWAWGVERVIDGPYFTKEDASDALAYWNKRLRPSL